MTRRGTPCRWLLPHITATRRGTATQLVSFLCSPLLSLTSHREITRVLAASSPRPNDRGSEPNVTRPTGRLPSSRSRTAFNAGIIPRRQLGDRRINIRIANLMPRPAPDQQAKEFFDHVDNFH